MYEPSRETSSPAYRIPDQSGTSQPSYAPASPAGPYPPQQYAAPVSPAVYGSQPVTVVQGPPSSGTAVASMVLGIIGAVGGWCLLAIPCLIAVVLGHAALADIKRTGKGGKGMAVAGLVLGYVFGLPFGALAVMMAIGAVAAPFSSTP